MKVRNGLINKCKRGDRRAQNRLYEQCYDVLISICHRYENNEEDARHLLNIGFLKIITNLDKMPVDAHFEPWIKRIMINTNIDEYRKNKRRLDNLNYEEDQLETVGTENFEINNSSQKHSAEELEKMIQSLPDNMQKVFNLFAIDGYSHKEIGEMLNIPIGTSKALVSKARTRLKFLMENSGINIEIGRAHV